MKNVILAITLIILIASACHAQTQTITVDPNSIVIANGYVTVDIQMRITAEQYEAMQYKDLTFADILKRMRIIRYYERLVEEVKRMLTNRFSIAELKERE